MQQPVFACKLRVDTTVHTLYLTHVCIVCLAGSLFFQPETQCLSSEIHQASRQANEKHNSHNLATLLLDLKSQSHDLWSVRQKFGETLHAFQTTDYSNEN